MGIREQPVPWAALALGVVLAIADVAGVLAIPAFAYLALIAVTAVYALRPPRHVGETTTENEREGETENPTDPLAPLGTLTAGIAHELNNPLTYLELDLKEAEELLAQDDLSPDRHRRRRAGQLLHEALEATETMRRTVRSLQVFARSRPTDEHAVTPIDECVRSAVSLSRSELRFRADLDVALDHCPPVAVAATELTQVIVNLIRNAAARFDEHKRGRLRIEAKVDDGMVLLTFSDDGPSMPTQLLGEASARFCALRPEAAKALAGSNVGLRLAVCHGIVSSAGGRISIDAEGDEGTRVRVWLPVATSDEAAGRRSARVRSVDLIPRRYRLLLIDDDRRVARALKRALQPHEVVTFSGGQAALGWLAEDDARASAIDAVICDVMMPGHTGPDVHRRLQAEHADLSGRMVFITGGIANPEHRAFFAEHNLPCLDKPVDLEALERCVVAVAPRKSNFKSGTHAQEGVITEDAEADRGPSAG